MSTDALALPHADAAPAIKKGMIGALRDRLFGERVEDVKVEDHTKVIGWLGRTLAPILLISCSLAFSILLTGETLQHAIAGGVGDFADWVDVITTNLTIIAADVSMLIAALKIRDAISRREGISAWWGYALVVLIVGATEALTFFLMLTKSEPPVDALHTFLDGVRAGLAPGAAVFLAVTPPRVLDRNEIMYHIRRKLAAALVQTLNAIAIAGNGDFAAMMMLMLHLDQQNAAQTAAYKVYLDELNTHLAKLAPNAIRVEADKLVTDYKFRLDAAKRIAQTEAERAQREMRDMLKDALFGLALHGALPDSVTSIAPELADLDFAKLGGGKSKAKVATRAPRPAENLRGLCDDLGVRTVREYQEYDASGKAKKNEKGEPLKTKARGVWIISTDIPKFASAPLDKDMIKQIAIDCGGGARAGVPYCAPLLMVLKRLDRVNFLPDAYKSLLNTQDDSVTAEPDSAA